VDHLFALAKSQNIEWLGLRRVREKTLSISVKDSELESYSRGETDGVFIEVLVNGQFGYAATSNLTNDGLVRALENARLRATEGSKLKSFSFDLSVRPVVQKRYQSSVLRSPFKVEAREIVDQMRKLTDLMKVASAIKRRQARIQFVESEVTMKSSSGSDATQEFSWIATNSEAIAEKDGSVQKRTDSGFSARSYQGGLELWWNPQLEERVKRLAEEAVELTTAEQCCDMTTSLVLMPDQMMLQIHESVGHPLEIDRILGDERNYAGWSFIKKEDFGILQYGSPLMNISFDPTQTSEFASYAFDDIGAVAQKEFLIQDGKLLRGLGSLESQKRSGLKGVATQRASLWNRPPIDRMANLNMEPGTSSRQQMIESIESGVLMESNRSWSIDDYRNKFQFGCEFAKKIENGKLTKTLRNPNYRGITNPFWRGLKMVGDSATMDVFGTPYCGKGEPNQAIRVGHASPICLFENVEVFGGVG